MFTKKGLIEIITNSTKEFSMKELNELSLNDLIVIFYRLLLEGEL